LGAEKGVVRATGALGNAVVEPEIISATTDTIYDVASLTKPLVTGLIAAILIEDAELSIDAPLSRYFGETIGDKGAITIRELVTHTSGLPAWRPFYLFSGDDNPKKNVFSQIVEAQWEYETGSRVLYSDFNFLLLGMVIEKITGLTLDKAAEKFVFAPLKLRNTGFNPPAADRHRIAASEQGNQYEKSMCVELFPGKEPEPDLFRNEVIWGSVHDGNCFYLGGVAGHAGLFSNAADCYRLALQFLKESTELLKPVTCSLFNKNFTSGLNQDRSLSFQLASTKGCSAGLSLPRNSFGHLGFTGTSIWIDGINERIFLLLTNRTHTKKLPFADISETRKAFNSILFEELESQRKG
jgi:CubicO group peptidase (beta-lactamase class C family)